MHASVVCFLSLSLSLFVFLLFLLVFKTATGLGECFLTHNGSNYDVFPAEGGHADFAPKTQVEFEIMEYIKRTEKLEFIIHRHTQTWRRTGLSSEHCLI